MSLSQEDEPMLILTLNPDRCLDQAQSPLFSIIPAEIRDLVFHYALLSDEDLEKKYDPHNCYVRPGYTCRRTTHTELLRTCQRIYREAWFRPWTSAEHTLFFTSRDRKPPYVTTTRQIAARLAVLNKAGIQREVDHIRIFAQLYMLEPGRALRQEVLDVKDFHPQTVTICLRHTDWWFWESDEPLRIAADWVRECRFPNSVTRIRMELETLERKKHQMQSIVAQMRQHWFFKRKDDTILAVQAEPRTMNWTGTSVWNGQRWLRDEISDMQLDLYVTTVSWEPLPVSKVEQKHHERPSNLAAQNPGSKVYGQCLAWPPRTGGQRSAWEDVSDPDLYDEDDDESEVETDNDEADEEMGDDGEASQSWYHEGEDEEDEGEGNTAQPAYLGIDQTSERQANTSSAANASSSSQIPSASLRELTTSQYNLRSRNAT